MKAVWRVGLLEWRLAWRSRAVALLAVTVTALAAAAAVAGQSRYAADDAQRQRYQRLVGQQFDDQPDRHPHRVSHYGYLVFRPRAPLGFFDGGIETYAGTSIFLEAHRQNSANFSGASQSGGGERFGELTPATVLQLFLPLFVFGVAGVSVTREREAGTLPLLVCQGASWPAILWGKWLGALLIVGAVSVPALAVSLGWLVVAGASWTSDLVARGMLLGLAQLVFLGTCAALAVLVSAWQSTSRGALVVLVGLWFALWVVLPRVLPALATALHPVPARTAFDAEVEARVKELGDSHDPNDPVFARLRDETLRRYGVTRVEDLPINYGGLVMQESEKHTADAFERARQDLLDVYHRQTRVVEWAGLVSPYLAIRHVSMALAGTDLAHHVEFERQAEAYRYDLIQALNDLHIREVDYGRDRYGQITNGAPSRLRIDATHFDRLPAFDYDVPGVWWALARRPFALATAAGGGLLILCALAWTTRQRASVV
jgi:ABC-2 type transport system permease protein